MKSVLSAVALLLAAPSALAFESYSCTVNNVTDGYFNNVYLNVDGTDISGTATVQGALADIGKDLIAVTYEGDKKTIIEIVYKNADRTESLAFSLVDVVSKLGSATRYSVPANPDDAADTQVEMICDIAVPI